MRRLITIVLLIGSVTYASKAALAEVDPFANIEPPEWTAAEVKEILKVGPPPFTQEDVDRWVGEMRPVVERVAGRAFTKAPVVRVVTREALIDAMADQMVAYVMRRVSEPGPEQEVQMAMGAKSASTGLAPLSFGQYIDGLDAILIPAENYPGLMRLVGCQTVPAEQVGKAVLAHELTHALQDQTLAKGLEMPLDDEQLLAFRATMEGQAIHVQALAADELGLADGHRALLTAMAPARVIGGDPALAAQLEGQKRTYAIWYRSGYRFMRHMADAGGMERVWEVLAAPPVSVAEIENPDLYGAPKPWTWPGEAVVFRGVYERFDEATWKHMEQELSPAKSSRMFSDLHDADLVEAATSKIVGGGLCNAQRSDGAGLVFAIVFRLDDASKGEAVVRAFDGVTAAKHARMGPGANATPLDRQEYKGIPCDGASRTRYTIHLSPEVTMDMDIINVWRGQNFVSMSVGGDVFDDAEKAATIGSILDAMDASGNAPALQDR